LGCGLLLKFKRSARAGYGGGFLLKRSAISFETPHSQLDQCLDSIVLCVSHTVRSHSHASLASHFASNRKKSQVLQGLQDAGAAAIESPDGRQQLRRAYHHTNTRQHHHGTSFVVYTLSIDRSINRSVDQPNGARALCSDRAQSMQLSSPPPPNSTRITDVCMYIPNDGALTPVRPFYDHQTALSPVLAAGGLLPVPLLQDGGARPHFGARSRGQDGACVPPTSMRMAAPVVWVGWVWCID
jgi:hypothetical protein